MNRPPDSQPSDHQRILRVVLGGESLTRPSPLLEADKQRAVADLEAENHFALPGFSGPYQLNLSIVEGRLLLDVRSRDNTTLSIFGMALGPFRRIIKDYDMMVESYATAVAEGRDARIQSIDMGRRGLHNEGAELLRRRLEGRIAVDLDTARRLFTLLCVLHQRIQAVS